MERVQTTIPSLSSSPRIRSLPHNGLSRAITAINSRTSAFSIQPRPPEPRAGLPPPVELPALPVPADDGLWLNDHQVLTPVPPEPPDQHPEDLVTSAQPRP